MKWLDRLTGKHEPTGKTAFIIDTLQVLYPMGLNQTELGEIIEEPEYVLRGMMDVLVDLQYVRMEREGNAKMYYYIS